MRANQKTGRIEPIDSLNEIHRFLPELQKEVSLQFFTVTNLGSSEVTPEHWSEVAETIRTHYDQFDGFVIVHGTNTMNFTAAALSFALQGLSKPVVLTGAILPINEVAGDGRMNLVYAIRTAQADIAEVCVVLGPSILRGSRIKKVGQLVFDTFQTPTVEELGHFHNELRLKDHRAVRRKRRLQCSATFDPNVALVTLHPGISIAFLDAILSANPHGIVLRTYGPGMLPEHVFDWLKNVTKKDIPILITSQSHEGKVDLSRYNKQIIFEKLGIISGKNMTYECAVVKMMWALAQTKNTKRLRTLLENSLTGELDE